MGAAGARAAPGSLRRVREEFRPPVSVHEDVRFTDRSATAGTEDGLVEDVEHREDLLEVSENGSGRGYEDGSVEWGMERLEETGSDDREISESGRADDDVEGKAFCGSGEESAA